MTISTPDSRCAYEHVGCVSHIELSILGQVGPRRTLRISSDNFGRSPRRTTGSLAISVGPFRPRTERRRSILVGESVEQPSGAGCIVCRISGAGRISACSDVTYYVH